MTGNGSNVAALARDWLDAKRVEDTASKHRIKIEQQICDALDVRDEGSITHHVENYAVVLTRPVYRKVDEKLWHDVAKDCPQELQPVRTKLEADPAGIKWLIENEPKTWKRIARAFTTTPGKVGVKIKENA